MSFDSRKLYFAATLTEVVGCSPVTFRAWRNRNGLLKKEDQSGWNRFSFNDFIIVSIVVELTKVGMNAQQAVDAAMRSIPFVEKLEDFLRNFDPLQDGPMPMLAIFTSKHTGNLCVELFDGQGGWSAHILTVVDLVSMYADLRKRMSQIDVPIELEDGRIKVIMGSWTKQQAELEARAKIASELRRSSSKKAAPEFVAPTKPRKKTMRIRRR